MIPVESVGEVFWEGLAITVYVPSSLDGQQYWHS
jgi:hypothetical protein